VLPARVEGSDLVLVMLTVAIIGAMGFVLGRQDGGSAVTGMRMFLWCWVFGILAYVLYGLGVFKDVEQVEARGPFLAAIIGGLIPLAIYLVLGRLVKRVQARGHS
jgi:hypothetical protein